MSSIIDSPSCSQFDGDPEAICQGCGETLYPNPDAPPLSLLPCGCRYCALCSFNAMDGLHARELLDVALRSRDYWARQYYIAAGELARLRGNL